MSYSSRFWLYAPLAMFLALAAGAMTHWWLTAKALDDRLKALNGHQAVPGVTASWSSQTISGFPFRLDVVLDNLQVRAEAPRGPLIWQSGNFASHRLTLGRDQMIFEAAGQQNLAWSDADGARHRLSFLPGTLRASAIADGHGLARFDLDLVGAAGKDDAGVAFTAARAQLHLRRAPKANALDLMLSATEMTGSGAPFGDYIKSLSLYATITQGSAFARLLAGQTGFMDALMAWRHEGGAVVPGVVDIQADALTAKSTGPELEPALRTLFFPLY